MSENPATPQTPEPEVRKTGSWWHIFLGALVGYAVGIGLLLLTGNPNLFPTVVLIGNLMIPISYVSFFYERRHLSRLTMPTTALAFLYGGLLGVFAASVLEPLLVTPFLIPGSSGGLTLPGAVIVALIEEFVKILGVLVIARRRRHDSELDGLILGAASGMGFAALESMGYAFTAFLKSQGSLSSTVSVTLVRGILSPLGHGTWSAILVGVLFRESTAGRYHINLRVIGAYLTVVALHALWDGLPILVSVIAPTGLDILISEAIVGAVGLFILWRHWREATRLQQEQIEATV